MHLSDSAQIEFQPPITSKGHAETTWRRLITITMPTCL
jgi:hypothetical protein